MVESGLPNVLLVVFDSVRARNTSLHGYRNETTPFLSEYAARTTNYTQARSPGTESISSHTSMFTGLHVREHGVTNRQKRLKPGETVWDRLRGRGYETAVFSNNPFLTELPVGLIECFDHVFGRSQELPFPDAVNPKNFVIGADDGFKKYLRYLTASLRSGQPLHSLWNGVSFKLDRSVERRLPGRLRSDSSASVYGRNFIEWVTHRDDSSTPWGACLNLMDAHFPYEPGPFDRWGGPHLDRLQRDMDDPIWEYVGGHRPWGERKAIEALYDGAIRRMDDQLGALIEALDTRGILEETLIVVTADHGEGFGAPSRVRPEHRAIGHGNGTLHECLLHVPLVVDFPGEDSNVEIDDVATLTRFPTLVESVIEDEATPEALLPDDGVVRASTDGIDPDSQSKANHLVADLSTRTMGADACFEGRSTNVRKSVVWGDRSATVTVHDSMNAWLEDRSGRDAVEAAFGDLSDANVSESEDSTVDSSVQSRLEDLGYA